MFYQVGTKTFVQKAVSQALRMVCMLMVTSSSLCLLVVLQLSLKIPRMIKEFWGVFIRDNILRTFGFGGLSINFTKDLRSFLRRRGKKKQIATFSDAPKSEFMELIC